ncbi:hypothetical protein E2C01_043047 [Portunus trituberculatus]|uniref:Uncharacterized protein n=1 Tax=Portunus trituberculatus TaxID=210409 RepID=A0A5B7FVA3_PORTR|nr:hypothetical protein [Portunus trituberculatus]
MTQQQQNSDAPVHILASPTTNNITTATPLPATPTPQPTTYHAEQRKGNEEEKPHYSIREALLQNIEKENEDVENSAFDYSFQPDVYENTITMHCTTCNLKNTSQQEKLERDSKGILSQHSGSLFTQQQPQTHAAAEGDIYLTGSLALFTSASPPRSCLSKLFLPFFLRPYQRLTEPTGDNKTSSGGREAGLLGETVNGAAFVALEAVLRTNGTDVQLTRGKHQPSNTHRSTQPRPASSTGEAAPATHKQIDTHTPHIHLPAEIQKREPCEMCLNKARDMCKPFPPSPSCWPCPLYLPLPPSPTHVVLHTLPTSILV